MDLLAFLGNGELSFEMSARSNLEVVLVSIIVVTVDVVTVDIVNVAMSGFVLIIEAFTSEVSISSTTVSVDVGGREAVVLVENHGFNALDVTFSSLIEFADVFVEIVLEDVDFAFNLTLKFGNSAVNLIMSIGFFAGKLGSNGRLTFLSNLVDDPLGESDGVDVDGLSVSLVAIGIEFDALS